MEHMAANAGPEVSFHRARLRPIPLVASLLAGSLFLASAALQLMASVQRWVIFRGSLTSEDRSAEDHLYDYTAPVIPWEPIENAAQLYGAGALLTAIGVVVMPFAVGTLTRLRTATRRQHVTVVVAVVLVELVLALLIASSFAVKGTRALVSGSMGHPLQLEGYGALDLFGVVSLVALAVMWRAVRAAMVVCLALLGSTDVGFFLSAYFIAPVFARGVSHDTTPWTETVVAATTAVAGIAMFVAARSALAPRKRSVSPVTGEPDLPDCAGGRSSRT